MIATLPARHRGLRRAAVAIGGTGVAAASGIAGVLVGAVGVQFGLVAMLVLMVAVMAVPVGLAVVIARPNLALLLVPLSLPIGARALPGLPILIVEFAVVAGVGLAGFGRALRGRRVFAWPPPLLWAVAFVALLVPATALAIDLTSAVHQLVLSSFGLLLASSLAACDNHDDVKVLTVAFVVLGAAMCAVSLQDVNQLQAHYGAGVVLGRAQGTFAQPNDLGTFANLVLFAALGCLLWARRTWTQLASAAAVLLALAALTLSLSRGSWIGAVFGLLALVVFLPGGRRRLFVLVLLGLVAFFAFATLEQQQATQVVTERLGKLFDDSANPYDTRPEIYREAEQVIEQHPLIGVGPGGFYAETLAPDAVPGSSALHAHNALLTVAAEAGLPATCMLVGFTLAVAFATLRAIRGKGPLRERRMVLALGCALVAISGQGLVDFTLRNPVLMTLVWFVLGLLFAWMPRRAVRSSDPFDVERGALEVVAVHQ